MNLSGYKSNKNYISHSHVNNIFSMDKSIQKTRLNTLTPMLKLNFSVFMVFLCIGIDVAVFSLVIVAVMSVVILQGGVSFKKLFSMVKIPLLFIIISCITIVLNISDSPIGCINIDLGIVYIVITPMAIKQGFELFLKAYGAVLCMYFLTMTTDIIELICLCKKLHIPKIITSLMYLIYRYIFLLYSSWCSMSMSASSRMGYRNYKLSMKTFSMLCGNLLAMSFIRSRNCYDAMVSRCYDEEIRFIHSNCYFNGAYIYVLPIFAVVLTVIGVIIKIKVGGFFG